MSERTKLKEQALSLSNSGLPMLLDNITAGLIGNNIENALEQLQNLKAEVFQLETILTRLEKVSNNGEI